MKPILARTWEGTWWHRTTAALMLAILLLATWQAVESIGDDSPEPAPIRRAYDLNTLPPATPTVTPTGP